MRALLTFLGSRLARAFVALWLVSTVVFVVMRLSGDPVPLLLPPDAPTSEIERVRKDLGLDRPILNQYLGYVGGLLKGDLGSSLLDDHSVADEIALRLPRTPRGSIRAASFCITSCAMP